MDDVRVLAVADDALARAGLAAILTGQDRLAVVGQADADGLPETLDVYRPDVVAWDAGWDLSAALDRLAELGERVPPLVILLPTADLAAALWTAGARGLLLRDAAPGVLAAALIAAARGLAVLDPELAGAVAVGGPPPSAIELTPRERDVLRLLAEGLPNKTIAHRLNISEHTVKFHLNALLTKLNAQSRTEAVVHALRLGLITL